MPPKRERLSDEQVRAQGHNPFVRPEHVTEGETLALTGFNRKKNRGHDDEQIVIEVENEKGVRYDLGVRVGSPDHRKMHEALGRDWETWEGQVSVTIREGRQGGVSFVNIASALPPASARR